MSADPSFRLSPMTSTESTIPFVGRSAELRYVDDRAEEVRAGRPRLVVIEGEPGIGKTALVDRAVRRLDGFHVLWAGCDAGEQGIAYEMVAQLARRLPMPRPRTAVPSLVRLLDPAAAGVDLLGLIGAAQLDQPVAVVVEDIQWADRESVRALGFVLRRLFDERVLTLVTAREDDGGWPAGPTAERVHNGWRRMTMSLSGTRELRLGGLAHPEVVELARRCGLALPAGALREVYRGTGGHPRLVGTLFGESPVDRIGQLDALPVPGALRRTVDDVLSSVPPASRALAEAIAVLDNRCRLGLAAQVAGVADPVGALEPLLESGLVRWWPAEPASPVDMRHPLQRDAVYDTITPRRRRALHRAAADLTDVRSAWRHRVTATAGVDAALADELDRAASTCLAERDVDRAVTYLLWAADISDTRTSRERRLLTGVVYSLWSTNPGRVDNLATTVEQCAPSALRSCALGLFAYGRSDVAIAQARLKEAIAGARRCEDLAWLEARAIASLASTYMAQGNGRLAAWYARQALEHTHADLVTVRQAVRCLVRGRLSTDGPRAALNGLDSVASTTTERIDDDASVLVERSICRMLAGELPMAVQDARAAISLARSGAAQPEHGHAYLALALTEYLLGKWDDAVVNVQRVLGRSSGPAERLHLPARAIALLLAAGRGEWDAATTTIRMIEQAPGGSTAHEQVVCRAIAAAGWAQARSDHTAMVAAFGLLREIMARKGMSGRILSWQSWWRPLLVEGLIGCGRLEEAAGELVALSALVAETRYLRVAQAWLSGWLAERRGERRAASAIFENCLALPVAEDDVPLHRARLEQAHGQLLLSMNDRTQATRWLRSAHSRYAVLGAGAYLDRCAVSLATCGQPPIPPPVRPSSGADLGRLTDREREVAHFAARGLTNHEAAARLYVSEKTVEFHLGNVYAKLGLTSRRQLRDHPALCREDLPSAPL
jgi:DNA-binding CsgD family transcriptional regulator/Tfp pilus assembly protein PilF